MLQHDTTISYPSENDHKCWCLLAWNKNKKYWCLIFLDCSFWTFIFMARNRKGIRGKRIIIVSWNTFYFSIRLKNGTLLTLSLKNKNHGQLLPLFWRYRQRSHENKETFIHGYFAIRFNIEICSNSNISQENIKVLEVINK